jgi:penicillin-binding protein 1C
MKIRARKNRLWKGIGFIVLFLLLIFIGVGLFMPKPLFKTTYSTVLESNDGELLGARIAADQQWRFPPGDSLSEKYEACVLAFEDRHFYQHPGINLVSLGRALILNLKAKKIVSGGSTITMQVCRLARGQQARTLKNKFIEILWAVNIELRYSKSEILKLYASHAPFGGNVVGIDAAAWRYFGRDSHQLSWAEAATLAVLPNAPSLIYPGKLDEKLKNKRDRLLMVLLKGGKVDSLTYELSIAEPVPEKVHALSNVAYHLTEKSLSEKKGQRIHSTINSELQSRVNEMVLRHHKNFQGNQINNMAVIVAEIPSKKVLAYVGNVMDGQNGNHGNHVDVIQSKRSSGSILKPFLYCKMLDEGLITPEMLIPDIPIRFGGFTPMNFDRDYHGAVPAKEALARSLNIPAVHELRDYGVAPFYSFLKKAGMKTLTNDPGYYGLSLILGGAEVTLWDLTGMYASLGTILKTYNANDGLYLSNSFSPLSWIEDKATGQEQKEINQAEVRAASIYATFDALLKVKRPESEAGWEAFAASKKIAWKTGTSFGFRDAWAVGVSSRYVVGVWVGNADGEGRPGLTGISAAAPVLFDVFSLLPTSDWFAEPEDEMQEIELCAQSGYRSGMYCDDVVKVKVPKGNKVEVCPWHHRIHLNQEGNERVSSECYPVAKMLHKSWFVLPPAMEYYYKKNNIRYSTLPPLKQGCSETQQQMEFVYPREWNQIFIPVDLDGTPGKLIFDLAHRHSETDVFWYLDDQFLGKTIGIHQFEIRPSQGWHKITVVDTKGNTLTKKCLVVNQG